MIFPWSCWTYYSDHRLSKMLVCHWTVFSAINGARGRLMESHSPVTVVQARVQTRLSEIPWDINGDNSKSSCQHHTTLDNMHLLYAAMGPFIRRSQQPLVRITDSRRCLWHLQAPSASQSVSVSTSQETHWCHRLLASASQEPKRLCCSTINMLLFATLAEPDGRPGRPWPPRGESVHSCWHNNTAAVSLGMHLMTLMWEVLVCKELKGPVCQPQTINLLTLGAITEWCGVQCSPALTLIRVPLISGACPQKQSMWAERSTSW